MYPILTLKKGKDRAVTLKHPWLFSGAIEKEPRVEDGEIIEIHSIEGKRLAYGYYCKGSQIRARLFEFTQSDCVMDVAYWENKFQKALDLRLAFVCNAQTNGYRLIHAEGDFLPGIIADVYDKTVSVQLRTKGAQNLEAILCNFLIQKGGFSHIYLRETERWYTAAAPASVFKENDLQFWVDVVTGQKTGFFLDQRDNRAMIQHYAKDKTVLNAFSYTGGFSVYALAGGAKRVVSLDISAPATEMCVKNAALNFPGDTRHEIVTADCFQYLKTLEKDAFDCIILDPPAFSKSLSSVQNASRGYKEINMKAIQKIAPNGILFTFSCSQHISRELFQKIIFGAAVDAGRNVRILAHLSQGADHPTNIFHPEGGYLKGLMLYVE